MISLRMVCIRSKLSPSVPVKKIIGGSQGSIPSQTLIELFFDYSYD